MIAVKVALKLRPLRWGAYQYLINDDRAAKAAGMEKLGLKFNGR